MRELVLLIQQHKKSDTQEKKPIEKPVINLPAKTVEGFKEIEKLTRENSNIEGYFVNMHLKKCRKLQRSIPTKICFGVDLLQAFYVVIVFIYP